MRKIRISVDKPVLDSLTVHHATSYQIASTPYFRPEDILVENLNDEIHKDYESPFETKLDIEKTDTIYCRTAYVFRRGSKITTGTWSRTSVTAGDQKGFQISDVIIRPPLIEYDVSKDLVLKTSPVSIFTGAGTHNRTSWVLKDTDGRNIYVREKDYDNLNTIDTGLQLTRNKAYIAQATHMTNNNNISTVGRKVFVNRIGDTTAGIGHPDALEQFSFSIETPFVTDSDIWYKFRIHVPFYRIYELEIRDTAGNVVKNLGLSNKYTTYFNSNGLQVNQTYSIYGRIHRIKDGIKYENILEENKIDEENILSNTEWKLLYTGILTEHKLVDDYTWIYGSGETEYAELAAKGPNIDTSMLSIINLPKDPDSIDPDGDGVDDQGNAVLRRHDFRTYSTYQLGDGYILLPEYLNENYTTLAFYKYTGSGLERYKPAIVDPLYTNDIDNVNILPIVNNKIVVTYNLSEDVSIDPVTGEGSVVANSGTVNKTQFLVYKYNPVKKILELEFQQVIDSIPNADIVADNAGKIYTIGTITNKVLKRIDPALLIIDTERLSPDTGYETKIENMGDILPETYRFLTLFRDINNNIYITGGVNLSDPYSHWFDKDTREEHFARSNNEIFIYYPNGKPLPKENVDDEQTYDENIKFEGFGRLPDEIPANMYRIQAYLRHDHKVVLFNAVHNGSELGNQTVYVLDMENANYIATEMTKIMRVPFRSTIVLRSGSIIRITNMDKGPQRSIVYLAAIDNTGDLPKITERLDVASNLIVRQNEYIEIEDIYKYNNVKIVGNGKLVWQDRDVTRTFTSNDLIITRNLTTTNEEINKYEKVFILDSEELTLEDE